MSISYTKINEGNGWTTQTSLGPTNLNHMEQGIKDACDAIDADCVQATDITPISAYELVSADVSTKAINDGAGNNIANQFASLSSFSEGTVSGVVKYVKLSKFVVVYTSQTYTTPSGSFNQYQDIVTFNLPFNVKQTASFVTDSQGHTYSVYAESNVIKINAWESSVVGGKWLQFSFILILD